MLLPLPLTPVMTVKTSRGIRMSMFLRLCYRTLRTLKHDDLFGVFDKQGDCRAGPGGPDGLYHQDTRFLSGLTMRIGGMEPLLLSSVLLDDNQPWNGPLLTIAGSHKRYVSCVGQTPEGHFAQSLRRQEVGTPDDDSLRTLAAEVAALAVALRNAAVGLQPVHRRGARHRLGGGSGLSPRPFAALGGGLPGGDGAPGGPAPTLYRPTPDAMGGYRGRSGIYELVVVDERLRTMIHDGASEQQIERHARHSTPSIRDHGRARVLRGETTIEEVLRVTRED